MTWQLKVILLLLALTWWLTTIWPGSGGTCHHWDTSEIEASLVYRVSSRTARAIQRNPVSKKKPKQNNYL